MNRWCLTYCLSTILMAATLANPAPQIGHVILFFFGAYAAVRAGELYAPENLTVKDKADAPNQLQ